MIEKDDQPNWVAPNILWKSLNLNHGNDFFICTTLVIKNLQLRSGNHQELGGASFIWENFHRFGFCNDPERTQTLFLQGPLLSPSGSCDDESGRKTWKRFGINSRQLDPSTFLSGRPFEFTLRKRRDNLSFCVAGLEVHRMKFDPKMRFNEIGFAAHRCTLEIYNFKAKSNLSKIRSLDLSRLFKMVKEKKRRDRKKNAEIQYETVIDGMVPLPSAATSSPTAAKSSEHASKEAKQETTTPRSEPNHNKPLTLARPLPRTSTTSSSSNLLSTASGDQERGSNNSSPSTSLLDTAKSINLQRQASGGGAACERSPVPSPSESPDQLNHKCVPEVGNGDNATNTADTATSNADVAAAAAAAAAAMNNVDSGSAGEGRGSTGSGYDGDGRRDSMEGLEAANAPDWLDNGGQEDDQCWRVVDMDDFDLEAKDEVLPLPEPHSVQGYYTSVTPIDDGYYTSPSCASPPSENRYISGTSPLTGTSGVVSPDLGDFASPETSQVISNEPHSPRAWISSDTEDIPDAHRRTSERSSSGLVKDVDRESAESIVSPTTPTSPTNNGDFVIINDYAGDV